MPVSFTDLDFGLETDQSKLVILDHPLADLTLADPTNANALTSGEWVTFDGNSKLIRPCVIGTPGNAAALHSFPLYASKGRTDVQSLSQRSMPIIMGGFWLASTAVFDAAAVVGSGAAITDSSIMLPVKVATVVIGGRNYAGLVGATLNDNAPIVGYILKVPSKNGGRLQVANIQAIRNGTT